MVATDQLLAFVSAAVVLVVTPGPNAGSLGVSRRERTQGLTPENRPEEAA